MLFTEVDFTTKVEDFIAHSGPKFSYGKIPLGNEFFVKANDLLFSQGISDIDIVMSSWEDVPCFFATKEKADIPFDIFAASFYLMSRYEEYLPHVKDEHGRYPATESLAYRNKFLEIPLIDIWISRFEQLFLKRFPELSQNKELRFFTNQPVIDVPEVFSYRRKGLLRTVAATILNIAQLRLGNLIKRYKVLLGFQRDPFDNFDALIAFHKDLSVNPIYFFLVGDYSNHDKNIPISIPVFRTLIKSVADYNIVSLMASYESLNDLQTLKLERKRLIDVINRPVKRIRSRYNRVNIPVTYRAFSEAEFNEDYSMGYTSHVGFKASTCTPFYFYDISFEEQLPLKISPFCLQYTALSRLADYRKIRQKALDIMDEVKQVNGTFITVFSNEILTFKGPQDFWTELYKELLQR